ncbi:MAG TPA: Crp/Fnr family transcriptional regulator [Actinomycetota bacterium]|nr:Crp/Fnr family transcriptional regulator [Actinomycetota bacterium]
MTSLDAAWVAANFAEAQAAPFSSQDLDELARHLTPTYPEWGEVLFQEREHPRGVWILQSGAIEIVVGAGSQRVLIRMIHPGEAVGDIYILRDMPSSFKARAAEPSSCLFIERAAFLSLLASSPSVARRWLAKLALQVSTNHNRITALLTSAMPERVARFLLQEGVGNVFRHSQATIASMLGVHRSSVNQTLREFEQNGLIRVGYRYVEILDRERLWRVATGDQPVPA